MAKMNKKNGTEGQNQTSGSGQMVHEDGSSLELPELFCSLGSLIVEGRLPAGAGGGVGGASGGGRGYYEGPHVELPGKISRHKCSQNEYLCNKNENFRKHMLLLWQNNVPMAIEILLCSDCRVGQAKARSLEVSTVPEPGSILLEQWTVGVAGGGGGQQMTGLSLLQAVRSYLHFSQLSAWYSKTGGTKPWNVLIRVTIPGEEFASKFSRPPEEHYFPPAGTAGSSICVSVRSLPRSDDIPTVICSHNNQSSTSSSPEEEEESKLGIAGALAWRDQAGDLRKSLVKSKLVTSETLPMYPDCPGPGRLTKSDSMDSMLGDSLIDPPQSLSKMAPKRYQSPSRCGSPSLEAPEPLMGYRNPPPPYDQAISSIRSDSESPEARLNRHDLLRRRDLTLFHGLHPRLFHAQTRLSLPPKPVQAGGSKKPLNTIPCRAMVDTSSLSPPVNDTTTNDNHPHVVNDRLPIRCTISGKHICQFEEEVDDHLCCPTPTRSSGESSPSQQHSPPPPSGEHYKQEELGAKAKGWSSRLGRTSTPYSRDSSSDSSQADQRMQGKYKPHVDADCFHDKLDTDMKQGEMDDVLHYLKTRNPLSTSKERPECFKEEFLCMKSSRRPSLEEIFDKQNIKPSPSVTQVYRSEISSNNNNNYAGQANQKPEKFKNLLMEALLRPQKTDSGSNEAPKIHSLRETSKYCSQSGDSSSSDVSPMSPMSSSANLNKDETNNNNVDNKMYNHGCEISPWLLHPSSPDFHLGDLCQDLQTKCLITKKDVGVHEDVPPNLRIRSFSETCARNGVKIDEERETRRPTLQPLDFSFDDYEDSWSVVDEENLDNVTNSSGDKRRISIVDDEDEDGVPSANKKNAFRKSFDSAASMVFQRRTGLPLTSSPAPMRRGIKFDFDSGINTPKDIKRALFEAQSPEESECGSPKKKKRDPRRLLSTSAPATISSNNLLCNFEESVLNGRLEPVSTVEGFTAEIGASGSFQPKHLSFPVTVFFYTLCENSNYASPYLGHINLGKKGYRIPERGTIQLTLFNPLGTVVKMFVVMYDLTDMPPNSQTFLRQRTLYMPSDKSDSHPDAQKWLRYLIHLRVASSKSGKIYLHTDVRMIIFRKSDLDTATDHESGKGWELRSFTRGPTNPKFSPRK